MSAAHQPEFDTSRPLDVREDHNCFGCGRLNPHGLQLTFYADPDGSVWAEWEPTPKVEGWQGIVHGGLITTVLDEVMGWALSAQRIWAVTARLDVSFRKPVEIGVPARARAWVVEDKGRRIEVAAQLLRKDDLAVLAEATGVFVRVPADKAADWENRYLMG
ncbi:MAG: PaaI family thioesterase [Thermomicrobiales bacterium]|nr:PaaI family thioesterase [Thermomicrobiales bacterium]